MRVPRPDKYGYEEVDASGLVPISKPTLASSEDRAAKKQVSEGAAQKNEQNIAQNVEQVSKPLLNPLSERLSKASQEEVEEVSFKLRKVQKVKFNTELPIEWKVALDNLAHRKGVGKYELGTFLIGLALGEIE